MATLIVEPSGVLRGTVSVPGDKSISHRALLFGALAEGQTHVTGWLPAEDCQATLRCVRAMGVTVEVDETPAPPIAADDSGVTWQASDAHLVVHGVGLRGLTEPTDVLDCGGSGTTMRLLAGLLAGQPFTSVLTGSVALRRRPMGRVADPLRLMGATVLGRDGGRLPPLAIRGGALHGINYPMAVASGQVKSALLLAGLFAHGETVVHEPGPARDHTERMLAAFGVHLNITNGTVRLVGGQQLTAPRGADGRATVLVPTDISSAAFALVAAALLPGSQVLVRNVGVNPTRTGLLDLLQDMGATVSMDGQDANAVGEPSADLSIAATGLHAVNVSGDVVVRAIDEFPIFTVAATQAAGTTVVRDAAELRVKESDRIAAVAAELGKMGAEIEERPDGMLVHGPVHLAGAVVEAHRDHRLAMALAVAGLLAHGRTEICHAEAINDSFPGFVEMMQTLGANIRWL